MNKKTLIVIVTAIITAIVICGAAFADVIKSPISSAQRAYGHSAIAHSNRPESWVRGSASINRDTGIVSFVMQLETDSVVAGPKGRMQVYLWDAAGKELAKIDVGEIGMGGKPPGRAKIRDFHGQATIPKGLAARVVSVGVTIHHTGKTFQIFGIDAGDLIQAIKIVVTIIAAVS